MRFFLTVLFSCLLAGTFAQLGSISSNGGVLGGSNSDIWVPGYSNTGSVGTPVTGNTGLPSIGFDVLPRLDYLDQNFGLMDKRMQQSVGLFNLTSEYLDLNCNDFGASSSSSSSAGLIPLYTAFAYGRGLDISRLPYYLVLTPGLWRLQLQVSARINNRADSVSYGWYAIDSTGNYRVLLGQDATLLPPNTYFGSFAFSDGAFAYVFVREKSFLRIAPFLEYTRGGLGTANADQSAQADINAAMDVSQTCRFQLLGQGTFGSVEQIVKTNAFY